MSTQRIVGIVLVIAGVILLIVGFNASDSISDRMSHFFTGRFTDSTVWCMVGGAAALIGGVMLFTLSGRRSPT